MVGVSYAPGARREGGTGNGKRGLEGKEKQNIRLLALINAFDTIDT